MQAVHTCAQCDPNGVPCQTVQGPVLLSCWPFDTENYNCCALPLSCLPARLQTWLQHKQAFRCMHGFVPYVKRDELVRSGSSITKLFTPLYPDQSVANFHIYGSLHRASR